ncbi:MAG: FAD-binding oxidoreductase, partial [Armatimonadetes bacterium]|nr:FAD-binding oxidoreductase [Akkermansiaceae bacterium]
MSLPLRKSRSKGGRSKHRKLAENVWEDLDAQEEEQPTRLEKPFLEKHVDEPLEDALRRILGNDKVSVTDETRLAHAGDKWSANHQPDVVVFAESTADVSKVLNFAHHNRIPVTTRGAGIGYVGGCVPIQGGIVLSMARMNKILGIYPQDGVAVVQPGVITGDLQNAVRDLGWDYPPDPASLKECTIGGNVATNAGGPRCLKYGVTRNYILGLQIVLANGRVMR